MIFKKSRGSDASHVVSGATSRAVESASSLKTKADISVVSAGMYFHGDIRSAEDGPRRLHVEGHLDGNVMVDEVIIGEGGVIVGDIKANSVWIEGRVEGNIEAHEIDIRPTAAIKGEILSDLIDVEKGAVVLAVLKRRKPKESRSQAPATASLEVKAAPEVGKDASSNVRSIQSAKTTKAA